MPETYHGQVVEIGGVELGKTGNEKPRKIVISDKPDSYKGKTFRIWGNDSEFDKLVLGQWTTVEYAVEERQGGPSGSYKQNVILAVQDSDGAGAVTASQTPPPNASAPSDTSWGEMPKDTWSNPPPNRKDETTKQIEAAWAITNAIALLGDKAQDQDQVHMVAHQLLVMKYRVAQEIE